jgi:multidrug resistance efflux pump
LKISSPKSGFVLDVFVKQNGTIEAGQPIVQLDSRDEAKDLLHAQTLEGVRKAMLERLSDEQLKISRRIAQIACDLAKQDQTIKQIAFDKFIAQIPSGMKGLPDIPEGKTLEADLSKAKLEVERAQLQLQVFDYTNQTDVHVDELLSAQFPKDVQYYQDKMDRLKVTSPAAGHVKLAVAVGSFVKEGDEIATIN